MMKSIACLYVIRLPVNDYAVAYVGVSKESRLRSRWTEHARNRKSPIGIAIQACGGRENVLFQVVARGEHEFIYELEARAIATFNTRVSGYNLAPGGFGCRDHLPSTRAKISEINSGRKFTARHRARLAAAKRGKKRSPQTCAKISMQKSGKNNPLYGKKRSAATRAKIATSLRGRRHSIEHRARVSAALRKRNGSLSSTVRLTT